MTSDPSSRPITTPTFGRIGYDAYGEHPSAHGPWTTFDGRPMPTWGEYSAAGPGSSGAFTQERWERAAAAIIAEYERRKATAPSTQEEPQSREVVASLTLTAWTPETGAALVDLAKQRVAVGVDPGASDEGRIDPFLMGLSEIATAIRDLAEATRAVEDLRASHPVESLIEDATKALHARVNALASPPAEPATQA